MKRYGFVVAGVICALANRPANAQTANATDTSGSPSPAAASPENKSAESNDRTLKGHTFLFPILQQSAFVTTHFGIRQGVEVVQIPKLPVGPMGSVDVTVSGLEQHIDLGVKVLDWLGIYANANGRLVTGVDVQSIVLAGGEFSFRGEGGAIARLWRSEKTGTQLSARLGGGAGTGRQVNVQGLVNNLIADHQSTLTDVVQGNIGKHVLVPTTTWTLGGAILAAQALSPYFSLQGSLEGRHVTATASPYDPATNGAIRQSVNSENVAVSIAFTADGSPAHVPVGAMLEYQLYAPIQAEDGKTPEHYVSAGVYYSGQRNLQVGVGGVTQLGLKPLAGTDTNGAPANSGQPVLYYGQFVLRYIWL